MQCELARRQCHWARADFYCDDCGSAKGCKQDALRRRERELLERHGERWLPPGKWRINGHVVRETSNIALPLATFARGFIDSVSLTTRQLVGGPCERCQGQVGRCPHCGGQNRFRVDMSNPGMWCERCWAVTKRSCSDCAGTGTLPGLAAALGHACPLLTRAVLTDREPIERRHRRWLWLLWARRDENAGPIRPADREALPWELFDRLDRRRDPTPDHPTCAEYPTREFAIDALATAAVRFCREASGD